jgi:hypothetical protein
MHKSPFPESTTDRGSYPSQYTEVLTLDKRPQKKLPRLSYVYMATLSALANYCYFSEEYY